MLILLPKIIILVKKRILSTEKNDKNDVFQMFSHYVKVFNTTFVSNILEYVV